MTDQTRQTENVREAIRRALRDAETDAHRSQSTLICGVLGLDPAMSIETLRRRLQHGEREVAFSLERDFLEVPDGGYRKVEPADAGTISVEWNEGGYRRRMAARWAGPIVSSLSSLTSEGDNDD